MLTLLLLGDPFEWVEIFLEIAYNGLVNTRYKSTTNSFRTFGKIEKQDFLI